MNKIIFIVLIMFLVSCSGSENQQDDKAIEEVVISNDEPLKVYSDFNDLIGQWEATNDELQFTFELTFFEDGTYSSKIQDSEVLGTWEMHDEHAIKIYNEYATNGIVWVITHLSPEVFSFYEEDKKDKLIEMARLN